MGRGINLVIIEGNIGQNPELKYSDNGKAMATCSIATSESWKDKNTGETVEKTEWHNIVFFNKLAEIVGKYGKGGMSVSVVGKLETRKWDKDGVTHYRTSVKARDFNMLGNKSDSNTGTQNNQSQPSSNQNATNPSDSNNIAQPQDNFDEIPF